MEEANVIAWRPKSNYMDSNMMIIFNAHVCTVPRSFAAGGPYPTAIVPIRPVEPLPFPIRVAACAVFILLFRMAIFVALRSMCSMN